MLPTAAVCGAHSPGAGALPAAQGVLFTFPAAEPAVVWCDGSQGEGSGLAAEVLLCTGLELGQGGTCSVPQVLPGCSEGLLKGPGEPWPFLT